MDRPIITLPEDDWLPRTLPRDLRTLEALRKFLSQVGLTVQQFKTLPMYTGNVDKYPWLREL